MDIKGTCISSTKDEHGPIYVYQNKNTRILSFDRKIYQSSMKINNINGLHLSYTQAMMTGLFFVPEVKTATIMGLGAGSMAKILLCSFPELHVHAIEYREEVASIAKQHFYLPDTERLRVHIDDAENYMQNTNIKSDIVFSDLYSAQGMEAKQVQSSYLRDCKNALTEQGVLVLNICHTTPELREALDELLAFEFNQQILSFDIDNNTIVLAFKNNMPLIKDDELMIKGQWLQEKMNIPMEKFARLMSDKYSI